MYFNIFSNFSKSKIFGGNVTDTKILINYFNKKNHKYNLIHIGIDKINENKIYRIYRRFRNSFYFFKLKSNENTINLFFISGLFSLIEKIFLIKLFNIRNKYIFFLRAGAFFNELETSSLKSKLFKLFNSTKYIYVTQGETFSNIIKKYISNDVIISSNWVINNNFRIIDKINLNWEVPSFVFIGWFTKKKGIQELLDFIKYCDLNNFKSKFIFIGDGPLFEVINKLKFNQIEIELCKNLTNREINEKIKNVNFYISLSHTEGLPNSLFETIEHGIIPIVTNVGCIGDFIYDNNNGIIFDNNKNVLNKILYLIHNSSKKNEILKNLYVFNISHNSEILLNNLYQNIIKK